MEHCHFRPIRKGLFATVTPVAAAIPNLTVRAICAAMAFAVAIAAPALAQVTVVSGGPQVPGFSNNYPWFNDVPQYQGNQSFRWFLANHPNIAEALAQRPGLLYNAGWRSQFPALEQYLANHPYEWQALNGEYWSAGPAETQWGAYDNGQWRDAYWWHQNNPGWFYDNHASWASLDSRWLGEDGAYGPQHQWHYGEWWYNRNPRWVAANHPGWLRAHQNWAKPAVQQRYRQQHAMAEPNQRNNRQQPAIDQAQRQHNAQRVTNQRQASVQHNRAVRQQNQHRPNQQRQASVQHNHAVRQQQQHQHDQQQHQGAR
jgi:hypothetical protein